MKSTQIYDTPAGRKGDLQKAVKPPKVRTMKHTNKPSVADINQLVTLPQALNLQTKLTETQVRLQGSDIGEGTLPVNTSRLEAIVPTDANDEDTCP